jgi:DNA polymerase-3 subunit alpha
MDQELNTAGRPPVRSASPWVDAVKLEKERELVGMFLSAHPLDTYYMELNYGMNTIKERLEAPIEEGRELTFGGMVTRFESRAARNGGNFGIMAVEDYSGSCEVRLFGKKYIEFANYGKPGTPVAITVRGARRFNGDLDWEVVRMNLLDELKGKLIKGVTLTLAADEIKPTLGAVLQEHISSGDGRGGGHLAVKIFDQESNRTIRMESAYRIPMDKTLVNSLNSMDVQFTFDRY